MVNTLTQEEFGEESVYSSTIPRSHSTIEVNHFRAGTQAETWRQEMKERPCRNAVYCLASSDLFSYQAYLPKDGTAHGGLGFLLWGKCPKDMLTGQVDRGDSSVSGLSSHTRQTDSQGQC